MNSNKASFRIPVAGFLLVTAICVFGTQPIFAQESQRLKKNVINQVDSIEPVIEEMAMKLWDYAELALVETRSADLLVHKLDEAGFEIETNVADRV